jgi:hypothetical protein
MAGTIPSFGVSGILLFTLLASPSGLTSKHAARIPLRSSPEAAGYVVSLLVQGLHFDLIRVSDGWVEVRQGTVCGWIPIDFVDLDDSVAARAGLLVVEPAFTTETSDRVDWLPDGGLSGLIRFAVGDAELNRKMSDPFYRDRIPEIRSHWGPFFYTRTQFYYVRGICLARFREDHIRIELAKRRIYYGDIFGSLWSGDLLDAVIEGRSGLLGKKAIFGKGREYFLGLTFRF